MSYDCASSRRIVRIITLQIEPDALGALACLVASHAELLNSQRTLHAAATVCADVALQCSVLLFESPHALSELLQLSRGDLSWLGIEHLLC